MERRLFLLKAIWNVVVVTRWLKNRFSTIISCWICFFWDFIVRRLIFFLAKKCSSIFGCSSFLWIPANRFQRIKVCASWVDPIRWSSGIKLSHYFGFVIHFPQQLLLSVAAWRQHFKLRICYKSLLGEHYSPIKLRHGIRRTYSSKCGHLLYMDAKEKFLYVRRVDSEKNSNRIISNYIKKFEQKVEINSRNCHRTTVSLKLSDGCSTLKYKNLDRNRMAALVLVVMSLRNYTFNGKAIVN